LNNINDLSTDGFPDFGPDFSVNEVSSVDLHWFVQIRKPLRISFLADVVDVFNDRFRCFSAIPAGQDGYLPLHLVAEFRAFKGLRHGLPSLYWRSARKQNQESSFDRIYRIIRTLSQFPASGPEGPTPQRDETEKGLIQRRRLAGLLYASSVLLKRLSISILKREYFCFSSGKTEEASFNPVDPV
jgi:hypothetical protein